MAFAPQRIKALLHHSARSIGQKRTGGYFYVATMLLLLCCWVGLPLFLSSGRQGNEARHRDGVLPSLEMVGPGDNKVLVSYSYFEKDTIQAANFDFFLTEAMGVDSIEGQDRSVDYVLVVNGRYCSPCRRFLQSVRALTDIEIVGVNRILRQRNVWLLERTENVGMDLAAHNASLTLMQVARRIRRYAFYIFVNSSARGPFLPHYMPEGFHWTRAFTQKLDRDVKAVGCSLVCLPSIDAGGFGPRLESWAFALDKEGLGIAVNGGVFRIRDCKLCGNGVVVGGEYALTKSILEGGKSVSTFLYKYAPNTDWRNTEHWNCNDNVHPSRHGSYSGISMHPFESVFIKTGWHVGEPFVDKYTEWRSKQRLGQSTTAGQFNEAMYRFAISPAAQKRNPLLRMAYELPYS